MKQYIRLLTIAGSDSSGGAGIQADLKTFAACGCYGMSVITALTAQNTCGVRAIHPVPPEMIEAQMRAVLDDVGVDAVKIGMLHSSPVVECIARLLREYGCQRVVLDPVMVATSGDKLIVDDTIQTIEELLLPVVDLITPNIPETKLLWRREVANHQDQLAACRDLARRHGLAVLVKGGHLSGDEVRDVLLTAADDAEQVYSNPRVVSKNTHGTGCTLSSAIAACWGRGLTLTAAVSEAEAYLHQALVAGAEYTLGAGHGPVGHFYSYWR
ncbi:MAG: bifunctional hydroxymethylpyrimidine kinase/phosphomethylpyrimidine kinase [Desulfopila sp.]